MRKGQRLAYIDWLKALGICFIVAGHMLPSACWHKTLLYSFHVPLFVMVGGMLSNTPQTYGECWQRINKATMRQLVPYLLWFLVFSLPYLLPSGQIPPFAESAYSVKNLWKYFLCWEGITIWNSPLWFFPVYYIISSVFPIYQKLTQGSRAGSFLLSIILFTIVITMEKHGATVDLFGVKNIMGARNIILLMGFYALGYSIKDSVNKLMLSERKIPKNLICSFGIICFLVTAYFTKKANFVGPTPYPAGYYPLSLYSGRYNDMFQFVVFGVLLCIFLILACGLLPRFKVAELLSHSSLFIMSTHYAFFLHESFHALSRKKWKLDLAYSIRDAMFIIAVYLILLYLIDCLCSKYPKLKSFFRLLGI